MVDWKNTLKELPTKACYVYTTSEVAAVVRVAWFEYRYNQFWNGGTVMPHESIKSWAYVDLPEPDRN